MSFLDTILNILFPVKCLACGKSGIDLCLDCLKEAPGAERESAPWIFPVYDYRHPMIKKSLWLLKYKNKKRLAEIFAEILYEKILEELSELSLMENFVKPILIPIPLSQIRYRERGYNQAELICEALIKLDRENILSLKGDTLIKPKETAHQALIKDRRERIKNIIGSFAIQEAKANFIQNRNIILIDDILTTGATLSEARKVLKQAGARKVIAFTVAH